MLSIFRNSQIQKRFQQIVLILVLLVSFMPGNLLVAQAQGNELFSASNASDEAYSLPASTMRSRLVTVNFGLLLDSNGAVRDVSAKPEVTLNLFSDAQFTGIINQVQKGSLGSTSWIGNLKNDDGYFYLTMVDGVLIAHVATLKAVYEVSSVGGNLYRVVQIDQAKLVDEPPTVNYAAPGPVLTQADLGSKADSGSQIDVMVVYTAAALAGEGSLTALKARIALAVAEANTSYANAGITPRLRLVHIEQVTYTETGNIQTDVNRLASTSDGYMDNVHSLRNTYGADMVSLVVENGGGYCGIARAIMASASTAFQVTARLNCMTGYYSFGHEFGHLQGARHDTYVDPTNTPYSYGHGYINLSARWRTVMSYNDLCSVTAPGTYCTRIQYWSNPAKTYSGAPTGTSITKNYQVLNNTAFTVANFRTTVIDANFSSTFNTNASGWTPVYGTWTLSNSAYYTTLGAPGYFASIKHTGIYGDLTYTVTLKRTSSDPSRPNYIVIRGNPGSLRTDKMWNSSYIFGYSNQGDFAVIRMNANGGYTLLKPWTISSAVVKGGWNTLKVVAVGSLLKYYINNVLVYSGADSAFRTGQVGVLMHRTSGTTGDRLYIDSASLSTTPTADAKLDENVAPGVEVPGGDIYGAP